MSEKELRLCSVNNEDCSEHYAAGALCRFHYGRRQAGRDPLAPRHTNVNSGKTCAEPGCDRDAYGMGYCNGHWRQTEKHGYRWVIGEKSPHAIGRKVCTEIDCEGLARHGGRCGKHHQQMCKGIIPIDPGLSGCAIVNCKGAAQRNASICNVHSARKRNYGLTEAEIIALYDKHRLCAGCGADFSETRSHIDHDHSCCDSDKSCGRCVRGLLCFACNTGMGYLRDSPEIMTNLSEYLNRSFSSSQSTPERRE